MPPWAATSFWAASLATGGLLPFLLLGFDARQASADGDAVGGGPRRSVGSCGHARSSWLVQEVRARTGRRDRASCLERIRRALAAPSVFVLLSVEVYCWNDGRSCRFPRAPV